MSKSILVIDDEEGIRKAFKFALEDTDYNVDLAASGEEGVEMQSKKAYSLIFLDLKMPGMNGVEVLRCIRERDATVPVYIVTAFHKEFFTELVSVRQDGLNFELMRKPIGNDDILMITQNVLEGPAATGEANE